LAGRIGIYGKAYLSTQQQTSGEDPWFSRAHGNQERQVGIKASPGKRPQATNASALLIAAFMTKHLRGRNDFQKVYRKGKRYEGSFISVFVLPNNEACHRFGITASRKALGNAVARNRAKRLLRESFRLRNSLLNDLKVSYDWVLNAKGRLSGRGLADALYELTGIIEKVAADEPQPL